MRIVVAYRGIPSAPGRAFGDTMVRVLRDLGHDAAPYGRWWNSARWMGCDASGDLLLYMECNDSDEQYHELRHFSGRRVYWAFDAGMNRPEVVPRIQFGSVYNTNKRIGGGTYLPVGFDTTSFFPAASRSGAAIVGTPFKERADFAAALGIDMINPPGLLYPSTVASLSVHVHAHASSGPGVLVSRIWETMGLGVALLAPRTPELEEFFTDGVHCAMYDSLDDAREKLAALLADDEGREAMAARGRTDILRAHTFHHRAKVILAGAA